MNNWQYILADQTGTEIGELLNVKDESTTIPLGRLPTSSQRIRMDNNLAAQVIEDGRFIKAYRNGTLRHHGFIFGTEEGADEDGNESIVINSISGGWRLQSVLLGKHATKSASGAHEGYTYQNSSPAASADIGDLIADMFLEDGSPSAPWVIIGTIDTSSSLVYGPVYYKPLLEAINELAYSSGAPEFEWEPVEMSVDSTLPIARLNGHYPRMGFDNTTAVFEYGIGKNNIQSWGRTTSWETFLNRGFILPEGYPTTGEVPKTATNTTSDALFGRFDGVIETEVTEATARQALVNEHVALRGLPRRILTIKPKADTVPRPFDDYNLGDTIYVRIVIGDRVWVNAGLRVYGMTFTPDINGKETVELELVLST